MPDDVQDSEQPRDDDSIEQLVGRWIRRLRRSHALYVEHFREEQFEEFVAAVVTSAFIERALLIGVQLGGLEVDPSKSFAFTLESLVKNRRKPRMASARVAATFAKVR